MWHLEPFQAAPPASPRSAVRVDAQLAAASPQQEAVAVAASGAPAAGGAGEWYSNDVDGGAEERDPSWQGNPREDLVEAALFLAYSSCLVRTGNVANGNEGGGGERGGG